MEYRRNTPLAQQMYSPIRQEDPPTELGYDDFSAEDIVNAYIAHSRSWRGLDEARAYDKEQDDNKLTNTNWNLVHRNAEWPEMQELWKKTTEARTKLGSYIPTEEEFERALDITNPDWRDSLNETE